MADNHSCSIEFSNAGCLCSSNGFLIVTPAWRGGSNRLLAMNVALNMPTATAATANYFRGVLPRHSAANYANFRHQNLPIAHAAAAATTRGVFSGNTRQNTGTFSAATRRFLAVHFFFCR